MAPSKRRRETNAIVLLPVSPGKDVQSGNVRIVGRSGSAKFSQVDNKKAERLALRLFGLDNGTISRAGPASFVGKFGSEFPGHRLLQLFRVHSVAFGCAHKNVVSIACGSLIGRISIRIPRQSHFTDVKLRAMS